jgi:hypothetical protein
MNHINSQEVEVAFLSCLCGNSEDGIEIAGVANKYRLHRERLECTRALVSSWLTLLPPQFHKATGGGWSFLNACDEADGTQWTGFHQRMEELFVLGLGLGLVQECTPREMWSLLPGGVPYYVIDIPEVAS